MGNGVYMLKNKHYGKRIIAFHVKDLIFSILIGIFVLFGKQGIAQENLPAMSSSSKSAEKITVQGIIKDKNGSPIVGANVLETGTSNGVASNIEGKFSFTVPESKIFIVSFIGYKPFAAICKKDTFYQIILEEDDVLLEDIIVTALGIKRREIPLAYSVVKLSGDELVRVKDPNMIVTLIGKIAGAQIGKSAAGLGGSAKVNIRGARSVASNNQPLFVIDGVPMLNSGGEQPYTIIGGVADAGNRDGGDGISNLNPEDIESISILKGAPAAALYGSQAANGVILITTKKGEVGKQEIAISSNVTLDKAFCLPQFQNSYGVSDLIESWGERKNIPAYDNAGDFFKTGITFIHSLSIISGNEKIQNYLSYANTIATGLLKNSRLSKHNITLRSTTGLFNDRLKLDGNINLIKQDMKNKATPGGFYMNPLVGLYRFPRGMDISEYRAHFEMPDPSRNLNVQNWHSPTEDFEQNPYWIANRIESIDQRVRTIASISAKLNVTKWFSIQARGNLDYVNDEFQQKFYASTAPALTGQNGRYIESDYQETLFYSDILAIFDRKFDHFSTHIAIGASVEDKIVNSNRYDSKTASLRYANVFNIANINMNSSAYIEERNNAHRQMQSLFTTAQIGYNEYLFLNMTMRNDWASTLAFTKYEKTGFFYPSAGVSWIMNRMLKMAGWIDLAKVRASWSMVGNDIPLYITNPIAHITAGGTIQPSDAAPFEDMKPEMNTSIEIGTEWDMFKYRLKLDATFYKTNTRNQFFKLPAKNGDDYAFRYVNAGDIENRGIEISIEGTPVLSKSFKWKAGVNYSTNKNKVIKLHEELPVFLYGPRGFSSSYAMKLKEGGSFGDIYGKAFKRDENGKILFETSEEKQNLPISEGEGNTIVVGNANPRFVLSYNNTLIYKNLSLYFLIDSRFGGNVLSQTEADLDMFGVTKATGDARDKGYVNLEGNRITKVKEFYKSVSGRSGVTEYYIYDATNIRLRELSFGYSLPQKWIEKTKMFKGAQFSLIARNLGFIYKKAPFDPDLILSTGNDNQAVDSYGMPTTRSIGFNVRFTF